ncbi:polysaccharide biosynthesis protein [Ectopseudomonas oleovorans]|nr:hypothetical protein [Pseudomonas oleovorans]
MVRLIMQVGMVFSNAIRPEVSRLLGEGNDTQAVKVILRGSVLAAGLAVIGLLGVAIVGPWLLQIWSSGEVKLSAKFLSLLALHAMVNVLWYVPATYLFAINRHAQISWVYMCISILVFLGWWMFYGENTMLEASLVMLTIELLTAIFIIRSWRLGYGSQTSLWSRAK